MTEHQAKRFSLRLLRRYARSNEQVDVEHGSLDHDGKADLDWVPVRPGTLRIGLIPVTEFVRVVDDGNGGLKADDGRQVGSINYATGHIVITATAFTSSRYLARYVFDSEVAPLSLPSPEVFHMTITSTPVTSRVRKLKLNSNIRIEEGNFVFYGRNPDTTRRKTKRPLRN